MPLRRPTRVQEASRLMLGFADRTGLTSERSPKRYLWTDAFAVCNFLGLAQATGEARYSELALALVNRVHHTLGRHRGDDPRSGWLSGLDEVAGEAHPTRGGLRIGKPLPERPADAPFDEELEWERDGQYFHYLTKWMHALDQVSRATGQPCFNLWARELAASAYRAFSYQVPGSSDRRLVWKMSIDLSRPLVPSMGSHDPLDGFITCAQLRSDASDGPSLAEEMAGFRSMMQPGDWVTSDPLGIGGLLVEVDRVVQLVQKGALGKDDLVHDLSAAALAGLRRYAHRGELRQSASRRLAFRELGLAIGLGAIDRESLAAEELRSYSPLGAEIEACWLDPEAQESRAWSAHRDINEVMLATRLLPTGFLMLSPVN